MRTSRWLALVVVVASAAACGNVVTVSGEDGHSNQNLASSNGTCEELCAIPSCAIAADDCVAECEAFYIPGCEAETEEMLLCAIDVVQGKCELEGSMCKDSRDAYDACKSTHS